MLETYEKKCPFCGALNVQTVHCNMFCNCGAKYYYQQCLWHDRNTGKVVYDGKIKFDEQGNIKKEDTN